MTDSAGNVAAPMVTRPVSEPEPTQPVPAALPPDTFLAAGGNGGCGAGAPIGDGRTCRKMKMPPWVHISLNGPDAGPIGIAPDANKTAAPARNWMFSFASSPGLMTLRGGVMLMVATQ